MDAWDKEELLDFYEGLAAHFSDDEDDPWCGAYPKDGCNDDIDDFGDFS